MKLVRFLLGRRFGIYLLDSAAPEETTNCAARVFLEGLKQDDPASHGSMMAVIQLHAEQGPIKNEERSHHEGDQVYAFKNRQGARLRWFYEKGQITRLNTGEPQPRSDSDGAARMLKYVRELETYIRNNASSIVNYGERYRNGERISTGFVESAVNQVVSKRMVKKQQMQ